MALLSRPRRPLAIAVLAVLAVPIFLMPIRPVETVSLRENRVLALAPSWPRDFAAVRRTPRQIDAYLADHFAFRAWLVRAGQRLQGQLGAPSGPPRAVEGRQGWLFLTDGLLQSSGQSRDPAQAADFADFVCTMSARLAKRGVRTGLALIPSPGEVYPEALPTWAGPVKRPTDYDDILQRVTACGVSAADLRPALRTARRRGPIYRRTDSHWTLLGAVVGYNAMLDALGRPDWRVTMAGTWRMETVKNGDLPPMAGLDPREERVPVASRFETPLPRTNLPGLQFAARAPFTIDGDGSGPTLLVIGDSYTENPMPPLFIDHVGQYAWAHHDECAFDWAIFDRVKPDLVLFAPAERNARCRGGRPLHMPP